MEQSGFTVVRTQTLQLFHFDDEVHCNDGWDYGLDPEQVFHCGPVPAGLGPEQGVFRTRGALFATPAAAGVELNGAVTSPEITLPNDGPFYLPLESWTDLEVDDAGRATARVEVLSADCSCDEVLEPAGGAGAYRGDAAVITDGPVQRMWRRLLYDLSAFAGKTIRVRLSVRSDGASTQTGWLVDNLEVGRGTLVRPPLATSLGACEPGAAVRFTFDACDEGFRNGAHTGAPIWHCAPPSRDLQCEVPDGPRFDSPDRALDASGRLMATGPGQAYVPGQLAFLRAPAIDISGCALGRVLLSFWHDYHFAVGDGGVVQAFDGRDWQTLAPIGGYPGVIRGTELGAAVPGFASDADAPSGWRRVDFDVTDFVPGPLYLRFGLASASGRPTRPGWFIDSVEVSRAPELPPEGLGLNRRQPACGLNAPDLATLDPAPAAAHDPCVEGVTLTRMRMLEALMGEKQHPPTKHLPPPTDNPSPKEDLYEVNVPAAGALCLDVNVGNGGFAITHGLRVAVDGVQRPIEDIRSTGNVRLRLPIDAGLHPIAVGVDEGLLQYQTLFAPGSPGRIELPRGLPRGAPLDLTDVRVTSDPKGRARVLGRVSLHAAQAQAGRGELALALRVTISRADRCRELRHIETKASFDRGGRVGTGERIAALDIAWDGLDDMGRRVGPDLPLIFTVDALPFHCDEDTSCEPTDIRRPGFFSPSAPTGSPLVLHGAAADAVGQRWSFQTDPVSWPDLCPGDGPLMTSCFSAGRYTDELALGAQVSIGGACDVLVRDASASGVTVELEQGGAVHPAMIVDARPDRSFFTLAVPVDLVPDTTALLHVRLDGVELFNSPKTVHIQGPSVEDLLDPGTVDGSGGVRRRSLLTDVSGSRIHAGEVALAMGMNLNRSVIATLSGTLSDGTTGDLVFSPPPGAPASGAEVEVRLPHTPVFVPGPPTVHVEILSNGIRTMPDDPQILLKPPVVLSFQDDGGARSDTFRRGDRVQVQGEGLRIDAYGASIFSVLPDPADLISSPAMRDSYEITLPDSLAVGGHTTRAQYAGVSSLVADGPPLFIAGRADSRVGPGGAGFSATRLGDFHTGLTTCTDPVTGQGWEVELHPVPGTVPPQLNVDVGRRGGPRVHVSQLVAGAFAGARLVGRCNVLLVSGRPVASGRRAPDFRFKVHRRDLATDRWTQVTGVVRLPDVRAVGDFIAFVSFDGTLLIRNLWLDTSCGPGEGPNDSNLEAWDLGCATPRAPLRGVGGMFNCTCACSAADWRIDLVSDELARLALQGRSDVTLLPRPVPLERTCDPDPGL